MGAFPQLSAHPPHPPPVAPVVPPQISGAHASKLSP